MKIALLLGVSTAYTFMGDYQNSAVWWKKTGELVGQMEKRDQFIYYNNLGNDHYYQQRYQEAYSCFTKAAALVKDDEAKQWDYYTALTNLAEINVCLGNAKEARWMTEKADSFFRKVDLPMLLHYIETIRIELTLLEGHTMEALRMAEHSEFNEVSIPFAKGLRLKAVEQVMRQTGNYQKAYEAHQ